MGRLKIHMIQTKPFKQAQCERMYKAYYVYCAEALLVPILFMSNHPIPWETEPNAMHGCH